MEAQTFDIRTGMAVYGADGDKIGSVTEIAGFGSARIRHASGQGMVVEVVTQASSSTGYFKVDSSGVLGRRVPQLCVPFSGIQNITPGHGVILNDSIIKELSHQSDPRPVKAMHIPKRRGWWPKWL